MKILLGAQIDGDPVAKGRPRATKDGRVYTPAKTRSWESMAAQILALRWGSAPLLRPVGLSVMAIHARPQSRPKTISRDLWALGGQLWRPSKPDLDNIVKAVKDAMEKAGVIANDSQICEVRARKAYAAKGEEPSIIIHLYEIGEVP